MKLFSAVFFGVLAAAAVIGIMVVLVIDYKDRAAAFEGIDRIMAAQHRDLACRNAEYRVLKGTQSRADYEAFSFRRGCPPPLTPLPAAKSATRLR